MKRFYFCATLLAAFCLKATGFAGEVYLTSLKNETSANEHTTVEVVERQQGPYFGGWLGAATGGTSDIDADPSLTGGLKLGYFFRTPYFVRPSIELEAGYLGDQFSVNGSGNGDLRSFFSTANLIFALDLGSLRDEIGEFAASLHPYFGAGIRAAYTSTDFHATKGGDNQKNNTDGGSKLGLAYQFVTGLEIDLAEDFSVFGEYKRLWVGETGNSAVSDYARGLWVIGFKLGY